MNKKKLYLAAVLSCGTLFAINTDSLKANENSDTSDDFINDIVIKNEFSNDPIEKLSNSISENGKETITNDTDLTNTESSAKQVKEGALSFQISTETDENLQKPVSGWSEDGLTYTLDNQLVSGEFQIDSSWYYFDAANGYKKVVSDFVNLQDAYNLPITKYYDELGIRVEGQKKIKDNWYYFDPEKDGVMAVGQCDIPAKYNHNNAKTVYYDKNGQMQYGQIKVEGKWKYFDEYSGAMAKGETWIPASMNHGNGKWCYFNEDGTMFYGQKKLYGSWKYFDQYSGARAQGEVLIPAAMNHGKAKWVYYNSNGQMQYGDTLVQGKRKYFDDNTGERKDNALVKIGSNSYYYNEKGERVYQNTVAKDFLYQIDTQSGRVIQTFTKPDKFGKVLTRDNKAYFFDKDTAKIIPFLQYLNVKNNSIFNKFIAAVMQFEGTAYYFGGKAPSTGFDCSGLMTYTLKNTFNYNVNPYYVGAIALYADYCKPISEKEARPGDLVFWRGTYGEPITRITHTGLYCGNGWTFCAGDPLGFYRITDIKNVDNETAQYVFGRPWCFV